MLLIFFLTTRWLCMGVGMKIQHNVKAIWIVGSAGCPLSVNKEEQYTEFYAYMQ